MRSFMKLGSPSHFVAFASRPIATMARKWRIRREDDALARLDESLLRDVGLDRCEIWYLGAQSSQEAAMRTMPRKDPILTQIDRLLGLAISAAVFLVVAITATAIIGSLWVP